MTPLQHAACGRHGAGWYDVAGTELRRWSAANGFAPERVADVLAVTSPQVPVSRNVSLTVQYLTTGATDGMLPSVIVALGKLPRIDGPKTGAFRDALLGDTEAVVLDVWMGRAFGEDAVLRGRRYATYARRVAFIGRLTGMTPAGAQAAIWTSVRASHGYKPVDVVFP